MKRRWLVRVAVALALLGAVVYEGYEVVESPGSQLFGKTLVSGPKNQRVVALTYDDGPNPPYTGELLSVLRAEGVHATFFVVGRAVAAYPGVVRREVRDGNAVGNHTWSHEHLVLDGQSSLRRTLERTDRAIFDAAGVHTRIMRPPFGGRDWLVLGEVRKLGYTPGDVVGSACQRLGVSAGAGDRRASLALRRTTAPSSICTTAIAGFSARECMGGARLRSQRRRRRRRV